MTVCHVTSLLEKENMIFSMTYFPFVQGSQEAVTHFLSAAGDAICVHD